MGRVEDRKEKKYARRELKKGWFLVPATPDEKRLLDKYSPPLGMWLLLGSFVFLIAAVEIPIIFFMATPEQVDRIMAFNGAVVIAGGLGWALFLSLFVLFPTKRLMVHTVVRTEHMDDNIAETAERAEEMMEKVDRRLKEFDLGGDGDGSETRYNIRELFEEIRDGAKALKRVADHFERPIQKPERAASRRGPHEDQAGSNASGIQARDP